ncbi:cell division initiation protein [Leifsonia xyli subsp. cynodontis DSM 46306]|uniref:Cell wall synthesis protein Wag31 n=1 Tax=Leifsonia xyli subsp. cynodontis DSM 46306 TaxID=1389489 RepID=U3P9Z1_LEIXC|nr:DivIVA domain-containing protein [Leifsonia xyli]AGW41672.1 cell division initiation protein [Leifsonia xyli subsp. cynodontis DSM 46306]
MALTPEDVVNKRFQPTKFREGYDQDEVDDFLDEVVVELRRLTQENEELKQRLVASDSRIAELQRNAGVSGPVAASLSAGDGEFQRLQRENEELQQRLAIAQRETAEARQQAAAAPLAAAGFAAGAATDANDPNATNNLLQLARRLHEEHVREGVEKRDALIAEGHATAARIVAEAESKQRAQITSLEQERVGLERRIEELRGFERDYRSGLKSYIENQLRDLDSQQVGGSGSSNRVSGVPAPVPASHGDLSNGSDQGAQPPVFPGFGG